MSVLANILRTAAGVGMDLYKLQQQQNNFDTQLAFSRSEAAAARNFSHEEAQLAYERELEADATKYQRQVSDLKAAGLNPMLAVSGGAGSVHSSPGSTAMASAPSAPNLGGLMQNAFAAQQLALQEKLATAEIEKTHAETRNIEARTEETGLNIGFFKDTQELRKVLLGDQHERNQWEKEIGLRGVQVKEDNQRMLEQNAEHYNSLLDQQADLFAEQKISESAKRELYRANARESSANASYKAAMMEVDRKYREATTETEKAQLKLLSIEARIKNQIYTPQYIAAMCKEAKAEAEYKTIMSEYFKGDYHSASKGLQKVFDMLERQGASPFAYSFDMQGSQAANALPGTN